MSDSSSSRNNSGIALPRSTPETGREGRGEERASFEDSDERWPALGASTKVGVRSNVTLVSLYKMVQRNRGGRTYVLVPAVGWRLLCAVVQPYRILVNEPLITAASKLKVLPAVRPTMWASTWNDQ
ncbi:hypothetical protein [Azospirillum sp. Marseille-Q6669]